MPHNYEIYKEDNAISLFDSEDQVLATITTKQWETEFFNRKFGALDLNAGLENNASINLDGCLDKMLSAADQRQYALIELTLEIKRINLIPMLEEKGFRLVDTKISYMTLVHKENQDINNLDNGKLRFAVKKDLPDILHLTHETLTDNPNFFSRFKNQEYFTEEEAKRYYAAWINNTLTDPNSLFVVYENKQQVVGFFIYKYSGSLYNKPIYKGILTGVAPAYRGNKIHLSMQAFLYNHIEQDQFYVSNVTQLTNYATIMNHVRSQKKLEKIELLFYRTV